MLTDEKSTVTLLFENGRERRGEKLQTAAAEREKAVCDFLVGEPSRELSFPEGGRIAAVFSFTELPSSLLSPRDSLYIYATLSGPWGLG